MILLSGTAILIWRDASTSMVIGLWTVALVAMVGLFIPHIEPVLKLSF